MRVAALGIAVCVIALVGCGGAGSAGTSSDEAEANRPSEGAKVASFKLKPRPEIPKGPHSDELVVKDIVVGTGAEVEPGDEVAVHYVAGIYETGEKIESAWVKGDPYEFTIGEKEVLEGWSTGVPGMKVGGRRMLLIPTTPEVYPIGSEVGDTLVYVIDLIGLRKEAS